jgi:hypothetical protein
MAQTTTQQRQAWKEFECNPDAMTFVSFGPDRIRVAPHTEAAWQALASVFEAHSYNIRIDDTDSYNCRAIKGGTGRSLHSFGIALDVNWNTNPFKETPDNREVRYSSKVTQAERAQDVKLGIADTDMTPDMIRDILAIKTKGSVRVFEWGGSWKDRKDAMHFELDVSPQELAAGIDPSTVLLPTAIAADHQTGVLSSIDSSGKLDAPLVQGSNIMTTNDIGRVLIDALLANRNPPAPQPTQAASPQQQDVIATLLGALLGKTAPPPTTATTAAPPTPVTPILSPIDKLFGGEALAGKKSALAVLSYVALAITQAVGVAGTATGADATPTGQILTALIGGFGGLGVVSKIDRVVQMLGIIAAKVPIK